MAHVLTDDQVAIRDAARTFARKELEPIANKIDIEEHAPPELTARLAELGFFGLMIPAEYGGMETSLVTTCLVIEEISKASPALGGLFAVQICLCPQTIMILGSAEQKRRILPLSASGERLMAYSQTEPAGAMNIGAHLTKLTQDGKNFRLNGAKLFCTQGQAKTYIVNCRTFVDGKEGYGSVLVERGAPGFEIAPYENKLGWRGTNTGGISFNNVLITPDNLLGDPLRDPTLHWNANEANFICHSVSSLGAAQGLFDKTLEQVKSRKLYGEPMYKHQPIAYWLAQIYTKLHAMRSTLYTAASLWDAQSPEWQMRGSACKAYVCETAFECTNTLLQIWGGSGMMHSTGVDRYMRDARTNLIAEGSSEMHTSIIAQQVLGLV